jgi:hypothetical protein
MTDLWKFSVVYEGGQGGPGTNTLLASTNDTDVDDAKSHLADFYDHWASGHMANDLTVTVPGEGDKIDSGTGQVNGTWVSGASHLATGADTAERLPFISQVLVQFQTGHIVNGRRLRGHIFLPGSTLGATADGKVDPAVVGDMFTAANNCFNGRFCVYSVTHHTFATISSCTVWDQFAALRSRRD